MAAVEMVTIERAESFEGRAEALRIRLTPSEAWPIRYVFSEWQGEGGASSNFGAMCLKLQLQPDGRREWLPPEFPDPDVRIARGVRAETIKCKASGAPVFAPNAMFASERWSDKPRSQRDKIRLAWMALCHLGVVQSPSLIVLHALLGERPPGLPSFDRCDECSGCRNGDACTNRPWDRSVGLEYLRVCRYAPSAGGSGAAFDRLAAPPRRRGDKEDKSSYRARRDLEKAKRKALLATVARECERLIGHAVFDYRCARRAVA